MTPFDSLKSETYQLIYTQLHQITTTLVNHALLVSLNNDKSKYLSTNLILLVTCRESPPIGRRHIKQNMDCIFLKKISTTIRCPATSFRDLPKGLGIKI